MPCFERAYEADLDKRDAERESQVQRERGGALRHVEDKLLFILFYFKIYPIQELRGSVFGMRQSQACEWTHRLTPIQRQALGYEKRSPARKTEEISQVLSLCPDLEFILDGTERSLRRPQNKEKQKEYYRGIRSKTMSSARKAREKSKY